MLSGASKAYESMFKMNATKQIFSRLGLTASSKQEFRSFETSSMEDHSCGKHCTVGIDLRVRSWYVLLNVKDK